ncbi:MAG: DnaJ domain-containing protein [Geminicoccaceae bacterium]
MAAVGDPRGYYQALGVDRTASAEDIRTAFRLRAKELHPDRAGETGDREAFRRLREAYEALRDPQQRLRYDTESLAGDRGQAAAAETGSPGADAVWRLVERLARLPRLPMLAALAGLACLALIGWALAVHRGGALADAEREIAELRQGLDAAVRSRPAGPLLEVELRFPRGTTELDAAMQGRLRAATAALQRQIAALPAGSRWQVAVDGLIDRAADQRGLLVDAWERTLLRVGVTAQYLVGHGIPADRVAVRFQAGDVSRRAPSRGEAIVLTLSCCADPDQPP